MDRPEEALLELLDRGGILQNRRLDRLARTLRDLPENRTKEALQAYANELAFGFKRVIDPGFQRLIEERTKRLQWMRTHAKELARLILLDLLYPARLTIRDAVQARTARRRRSSGGGFVRIDDRELRRLMTAYYPELFVKGGHASVGLCKDGRIRSVSTFHGQADESVHFMLALLTDSMMASFSSHVRTSPRTILEVNAAIRLVEPRASRGLLQFCQDLNELLEDILGEFGKPAPDRQRLVLNVQQRGPAVEHLYQELRFLLEARWFRTRKKQSQDALLRMPASLPYARKDAADAVSTNQAWLENSEKTVNIVSRGADAYARMGRPRVGVWLFGELLNQLKLDELDRGLCHYNLAMCYCAVKNPRKMASELQTALEIQQRGGHSLDAAITLAALAEANFILRRHRVAARYRAKAETLLLSSPHVPVHRRAYGLLQMADCAQRAGRDEWERSAIDAAFQAATDSNDTDLQLYLSQRMTDLNAGLSGKVRDDLPGRVAHPSEWTWANPRLGLFLATFPGRRSGS